MSAMSTLSSSEDEFSFGPNERVSLTAADFEESGTDSDFPASSSSGEEEENPYLAAIASPGTRARRESPVAARPLRPLSSSPSRSPREERRPASGEDSDERDVDDDVDAGARSARSPLTRSRSPLTGIEPRGGRVETTRNELKADATDARVELFSRDVSPAPEPARVAPPKATAFRAVDGDGEKKIPTARRDDDDGSALERRVETLERALASLAVTAQTLQVAKDDAELRLERAEARVGELEENIVRVAESRVTDASASGDSNLEPNQPVEIDGDSIAAIERVVEEATRAAMRSADAKSVVEAAVTAATKDAVEKMRADLEATLSASARASVREHLVSANFADRDEVKRLLESQRVSLETHVADSMLTSRNHLERVLDEKLESRSRLDEKFTRDAETRLITLADASAKSSVARALQAAETRLLEATNAFKATIEQKVSDFEESAKSHAERVRRATKRAAAVEAIVSETESRARSAETVAKRSASLVAAAEDASRRVERVESAVADVVDTIAEQLSAFKSESKQREEQCVAHAERAERAAEEARKSAAAKTTQNPDDGSLHPRASFGTPRDMEDENAEIVFPTPARVSSARAKDSRARAEATARRLAASVEALHLSGEKGEATLSPTSLASAELLSASKLSNIDPRRFRESVSSPVFSTVSRETERLLKPGSPAVTARSPRARKREWVA